ncbi:MAG: outer membrane protein assembly factor BamE [Rhodobacterales bacterium]|nr:outer membrane protein assembly factor BamE [Rhodobacterales bacterium]
MARTGNDGGSLRSRGAGRALRALLLAALIAGCSPIYRNHGYVPTESELEQIVVGVDTRDSVAETVGRPAAAGLLNDTGWFYVQSRWEQRGARAPQEIDRKVVAITFDDQGVVQNLGRYGLQDGNVVILSRRVTETNIRGVSFIAQLLGNVGRLRAEDVVD